MKIETYPDTTQDSLPEQTPAERLGVIDGEFAVMRSNGMIDREWTLYSDETKTHLKSGELVPAVMLFRRDPDNPDLILKKVVPKDTFLEWQVEDAEIKRYEALFKVEVAEDMGGVAVRSLESSPQDAYLAAREEHYRRLFAPVAIEEKPAEEVSYDHLFDPEYEAPKEVRWAASKTEEGRGIVTTEGKEKAEQILGEATKIDHRLRVIFEDAVKRVGEDVDLTELVRTDPEVRLSIGKHIIEKIQKHMSMMPERVVNDTEKNPNHSGYSAIKSREYVALLTLAMLDGSFNHTRQEKIYDFDSRGVAVLGQHRYAARYLLEHA